MRYILKAESDDRRGLRRKLYCIIAGSAVNSSWVHLRICQSCGKMLCCDSSVHQHARRHYEETAHSVISSAELGEQWL
ncbi:UBP-type zinc finger domain-containing protein [Nostoc sp. 'Peltigera membranacea cyanobiont' 232]|uniref:UBP-type zinc finger domain-containing protein n=1 Tax=Nostoc sp. 'Peltigera membranacea cyanobiont' 232 TaxID=2014531 RepID=UPI001CB89977